MSKTEHVVCHSGDKSDGMAYALECKNCGTIQKVAVPISVDCYIALGKAFAKRHRNCKENQERKP